MHTSNCLTRRHFMQSLIAAGIVTWAPGQGAAQMLSQSPKILEGTTFDLTIDKLSVNFSGKPRTAVAVNGSVPAPTLRWREGETVTINVTNRLKTNTSIHWHGMRIPTDMDGVPGLSFEGIRPGETFTYRFPVRQNGTFWYHSHSGYQEQTGISGAIIIEPQTAESEAVDREYVIFLSDWTDVDPHTILSNLKEDGSYYNYHRPALNHLSGDPQTKKFSTALAQYLMWSKMNMSPTDIADVSGSVYTYLCNGVPPSLGWKGLFEPGEKVKLRIVNGSAMTFFDVRIPGLQMKVVAADGNAVEPVMVDEFRIGTAETYDVIVSPENMSYVIFAQAEDRTGYAKGILATSANNEAKTPTMDPRPIRTMADMGMKMKGMAMPAMSGDGKMNMSGMQGGGMEGMSNMDMPANTAHVAAGHDTSSMTVRSDSAMNMHVPPEEVARTMWDQFPLPQPGRDVLPVGTPTSVPSPLPHLASVLKVGPEVSGIAVITGPKLSDPGVGLQHNGRRVLAYSDLKARYPGVDRRSPTREIELHLTGNMERFIWGFDGKKFSQAQPITLRYGERVRIILVNDTMMEHPIHLHGLWSELENGNGSFNPYKHTLIVKPAERLSYLVSADVKGHWAYHCHLMFHMEAGMFRTVVVA
ncbi:copper resistance system multicopper oxidase [Granulicella sp. WH15]|uniref:copper resistance system multicopper oxidase n=1 Tax=Granulicella sp. WH15 TaxID=2602070 RepID=UPI0013677C90|nr:copper resistance system multicopper oxidase [Granulicella sp. WH15]QHN04716.1 copper resistance system multicopper oxidase [Granulicella sp. WH15]